MLNTLHNITTINAFCNRCTCRTMLKPVFIKLFSWVFCLKIFAWKKITVISSTAYLHTYAYMQTRTKPHFLLVPLRVVLRSPSLTSCKVNRMGRGAELPLSNGVILSYKPKTQK